jgi:hypothetical protein
MGYSTLNCAEARRGYMYMTIEHGISTLWSFLPGDVISTK